MKYIQYPIHIQYNIIYPTSKENISILWHEIYPESHRAQYIRPTHKHMLVIVRRVQTSALCLCWVDKTETQQKQLLREQIPLVLSNVRSRFLRRRSSFSSKIILLIAVFWNVWRILFNHDNCFPSFHIALGLMKLIVKALPEDGKKGKYVHVSPLRHYQSMGTL